MMRPPYLPLMGGESTSEAAQGKDARDLPDMSAKSQRTLDSPFRAEVSQLVWALARRPEPRCFDYPRGILGHPEMVTESLAHHPRHRTVLVFGLGQFAYTFREG
jgi:hypothetical protein